MDGYIIIYFPIPCWRHKICLQFFPITDSARVCIQFSGHIHRTFLVYNHMSLDIHLQPNCSPLWLYWSTVPSAGAGGSALSHIYQRLILTSFLMPIKSLVQNVGPSSWFVFPLSLVCIIMFSCGLWPFFIAWFHPSMFTLHCCFLYLLMSLICTGFP